MEVASSLWHTQLFVLLHIHALSGPNPSSISLFFVFFRLSGPVPRRIQTVVCMLLSVSSRSIYMKTERLGVPSENRADRTERVLFFGSANTISTTSRDLRKSIRRVQKQGWSRNDNAHCSLCIECSLASFIFRAGISAFCPLLFMLSFFHPVYGLSLSI